MAIVILDIEGNDDLRKLPARVQREALRHQIVALILLLARGIDEPAEEGRTFDGCFGLREVGREVCVELHRIAAELHAVVAVEVEFVGIGEVVEVYLLAVLGGTAKLAALIIALRIADDLIEIRIIIEVIELYVNRLVETIGYAVARLRFDLFTVFVDRVILEPVVQRLYIIRCEIERMHRLVARGHGVDVDELIVVVLRKVPRIVRIRLVEGRLPELRDVRAVLRRQGRSFARVFIIVRVFIIASGPGNGITLAAVTNGYNRRAIRLDLSGGGVLICKVRRIQTADGRTGAGNLGSHERLFDLTAEIGIIVIIRILSQIDDRIVYRGRFPLRIDRGIAGQRDGSVRRDGAIRIQIPAAEGVARTGRGGIEDGYRCRRCGIAGIRMGMYGFSTAGRSSPVRRAVASTFILYHAISRSGLSICMRMRLITAGQFRLTLYGLALLSIHNHSFAGVGRFGRDVAATLRVVGQGEEFGLVVYIGDVGRILFELQGVRLDKGVTLIALRSGIDHRTGRALEARLRFEFDRAFFGEGHIVLIIGHLLHGHMMNLIYRVRLGIGNVNRGGRFRELSGLDHDAALARIIVLTIIGNHRGRNDFVAHHIEVGYAVVRRVAGEILALHGRGHFRIGAFQHVVHNDSEHADGFKDRRHLQIFGDRGRRGDRVAVLILPSPEGVAALGGGFGQGGRGILQDVLAGNGVAIFVLEGDLIVGIAFQFHGIKGGLAKR